MNYTLHQLRVFVKVVEKESVTKAAAELHLTQPAVSIQLKNLQDQFDIPLIEIVNRKLTVTDFGREVADAAKRILSEVRSIESKTMAYKGYLVGQLKISVVSTGKYSMPFFISGFLKQHPGVDLIMDVTNKSQVLKTLEQNEVDFAMMSVIPGNLQHERVELMPNTLCLIGSNSYAHPISSVTLPRLGDLPLIYREKGSATREAMEKFIINNKIPIKKTMQLTSNEAVKQAVLAGLGYSIMPLIGIKNELINGDLHIVKVKGLPLSTTWNLVWLKNKKLSPLAIAYLDYLNNFKSEIINQHFGWYEDFQNRNPNNKK